MLPLLILLYSCFRCLQHLSIAAVEQETMLETPEVNFSVLFEVYEKMRKKNVKRRMNYRRRNRAPCSDEKYGKKCCCFSLRFPSLHLLLTLFALEKCKQRIKSAKRTTKEDDKKNKHSSLLICQEKWHLRDKWQHQCGDFLVWSQTLPITHLNWCTTTHTAHTICQWGTITQHKNCFGCLLCAKTRTITIFSMLMGSKVLCRYPSLCMCTFSQTLRHERKTENEKKRSNGSLIPRQLFRSPRKLSF